MQLQHPSINFYITASTTLLITGGAGGYPRCLQLKSGVIQHNVTSSLKGYIERQTIICLNSYSQFRVQNLPHVHVFRLCEQVGVRGRNPCKHMKTPHRPKGQICHVLVVRLISFFFKGKKKTYDTG